jgi:23S rRNA (adenine2503-C2)-methyltransferase
LIRKIAGDDNDVTFLVATNAKIDIRSLQFQELEDKVREFREPLYRARQIADWLYQKRVQSFDEMTDLPQEFRSRLAEQFDFSQSEIVRVLGSHDTTRKFLLRLNDESLIETVLIPASPALTGSRLTDGTICVSSRLCLRLQVLCASKASAAISLNEIVDQIIAVERDREKIDNIGSWEWASVATRERDARDSIINARGVGIGARHITVSISGLAPQIRLP